MSTDPILEELYQVRRELSARFGNDPEAIFRYLKEQERLSGRVLIDPPKRDRPAEGEEEPRR